MLKLYADPAKAVELQDRLIKERIDAVLFVKSEEIVVFKGEGEINEEYCGAHNIPVHFSKNSGGAIVMFPEDQIVAYFTRDKNSTAAKRYIHAVVDFLQSKGLDAAVIDNDVLIDGKYKVASSSKVIIDDMSYEAFFFSMAANNDIVSEVCMKEQKKIPKGAKVFGITSEDAQEFIEKFFDELR